jgi:hypothetical protein
MKSGVKFISTAGLERPYPTPVSCVPGLQSNEAQQVIASQNPSLSPSSSTTPRSRERR